jgi:hypothetical protein
MKALLLFAFSFLFLQFAAMSQGYTFFSAQGGETIQKNAIMPAETGVYIAMQKSASSSSLYWLKDNVLTEIKSIGNQYASVYSTNGTYGKQWFTHGDRALFVSQNGFINTRSSAVWITDGTASGTDTLFTFGYGTNVNIAGMIGNELYFSITSLTPYQTVLYKTDFTIIGTVLVKSIGKTNLTWNYVDNGVLYLNGYVKKGIYSYAVLYAYSTDTTRLITGENYFPAKVIKGNLYAYADGRNLTRQNLTTKAVTSFYFPDTKEEDRTSHVDQIIGILNDKLYLKCNLSLSANNIANCRIYVGNMTDAKSTIDFTELRSSTGVSIPLSNANFRFEFGESIAYFFGMNGYLGPITLFSTDGTSAGTKPVQELMTGAAWAFAPQASMKLCGDRVYYYGPDYKTGTVLQTGRALSSGDATSGELKLIDLNAGPNPFIQDIENFQGKLLYSLDSFTSGNLYTINACSSASTTGIKKITQTENNMTIYPNPSNGTFTIEMKENPNNSSIEIYNLLGKKVYSQVIHTSKIILNLNLHSGVYFLNVRDAKGQDQSKKLIVK